MMVSRRSSPLGSGSFLNQYIEIRPSIADFLS